MKQTLSYVIVTPYSVVKSRTGGVISRLLSRTTLELAGAQIFTPDYVFAKKYADSLRRRSPQNQVMLLADYIEQNIAPSGGRPHRSLLLLFRGENPCGQLADACGHLYFQHIEVDALSGESIRDTYADLIFSKEHPEKVSYFEPAVLTPRSQEEADEDLKLMAGFLENKDNIVQNILYPDPSKVEQTLVIIKPDNWHHASGKPGTIIDMFSRTGLRIVGIKVFSFSLNQALGFYGPVEARLIEKLAPLFGLKAREILEREFSIPLDQDTEKGLSECFGREYAKEQFRKIIEFMSGRRPDTCPPGEEDKPGGVKCMILVYEGENAIQKIRDVLGPTDPLKAPNGTVRREFGSNTMINTAHASDSRESYEVEKQIVKIHENSLVPIIYDYLAGKKKQ
jgi:nucleoside diphosphate kinase